MEKKTIKFSATAAISAPVSAPILFRGDILQSFEKAVDSGYDAVEFHIRSPKDMNSEEISIFCEERGTSVSTIGTGMGYTIDKLSLMDVDRSIRTEAVNRLKEHITLAGQLRCGVIIGSMRGRIPASDEYSKYFAYYREGIMELTDFAEKENVTLYLEAINRYESNFHNTADEMAGFTSDIGSDRLKLLVDTFHMNIEEVDVVESLRKNIRHIGHLHFADSNRRYPGAGHIDFKNILSELADLKYNGYIALECLPYPEPLMAARSGICYLKALLYDDVERI